LYIKDKQKVKQCPSGGKLITRVLTDVTTTTFTRRLMIIRRLAETLEKHRQLLGNDQIIIIPL
jgi:hypothetical protein